MSNESARQNNKSELVKVGQASETGEGVRMMRGRDKVGVRAGVCVCGQCNQRLFINQIDLLLSSVLGIFLTRRGVMFSSE